MNFNICFQRCALTHFSVFVCKYIMWKIKFHNLLKCFFFLFSFFLPQWADWYLKTISLSCVCPSRFCHFQQVTPLFLQILLLVARLNFLLEGKQSKSNVVPLVMLFLLLLTGCEKKNTGNFPMIPVRDFDRNKMLTRSTLHKGPPASTDK